MKFAEFILPILACLLMTPTEVRAQDDSRAIDAGTIVRSGSIEGIVHAAGGHGTLERVRVELSSAMGESISVAYTDSNGKFEFRSLRKGNYVLNFSAPGYDSLTEDTDLSSGSLRGLEISLKRTGEEPPQAPP